MAVLAPPPAPPSVSVYDNDGLRRFRERVFQVLATVVTVLVTAWICTYGWIPAILALMVAKHILVAILVWGLNIDAIERRS
jgi:Ca2+-dependent lipid-binding protein